MNDSKNDDGVKKARGSAKRRDDRTELRSADGLLAAFEALPTPVLLADAAMRIVYVNPAAQAALEDIEAELLEVLDLAADELLGTPLDSLFAGELHGTSVALVVGKGRLNVTPVRHSGAIVGHAAHLVTAVETIDVGRMARLREAIVQLVDGRVSLQIAVGADDVIGSVERAAAALRESYIKDVKQIGTTASALASSSEGLAMISQQMITASEQTASQATVVAGASEQVQRAVQTVATASEELSSSITEIARNAIDAAKVAERAVSVARTTTDTIGRLGTSSNEIGAVIKVITGIAQQTNLLALNATIEAARAGEVGKGFAVVANEVKELAKETARATEDISQRIEAIQGSTHQATNAIVEISRIIGQINEIQTVIASAVEEQSVTTGDIARNVSEASRGVSEITHNMTSVAEAAKQTAVGASSTQVAATDVQRFAGQLQAMLKDRDI